MPALAWQLQLLLEALIQALTSLWALSSVIGDYNCWQARPNRWFHISHLIRTSVHTSTFTDHHAPTREYLYTHLLKFKLAPDGSPSFPGPSSTWLLCSNSKLVNSGASWPAWQFEVIWTWFRVSSGEGFGRTWRLRCYLFSQSFSFLHQLKISSCRFGLELVSHTVFDIWSLLWCEGIHLNEKSMLF